MDQSATFIAPFQGRLM